MKSPLEGIRILEWGVFHAGPAATAILSEMGAEVLKIEEPETGDPVRMATRFQGIDFELGNGRNLFAEAANRGKKSITIDLSKDRGRQIAYNLVEKSDVFFTNLRLSTRKNMKMDYESLSQINPNLIYSSVTSYGPHGPDADKGGFDFQGQARSGLMYSVGEPGMKPLMAQFGLIDQTTAIMASYQTVIAILMRERFGIVQKVDVSLLGCASYMMYLNNLYALMKDQEIPRHEQACADPLRNYYQCKDGKWLVQTHSPIGGNWGLMCRLLGLDELAQDSRYDSREKRMDHSRELIVLLNEKFSTRNRDEWIKLFSDHNLMVCPVNTTMEAINDPQMTENNYVTDYDHPEFGKIRIPGFPIEFSRSRIDNELLAPKLGEHTEMVLKEIGGYKEEEITRFKKDKVV